MKSKLIILIFLFYSFLNASTNILTTSQVYIDKQNTYTIKDIQKAKFKEFKTLETNKINLGYIPYNVWIKFSLSNNSDKNIKKVLVLDNQMLDYITLFTKEKDRYKKDELGVLKGRTFEENILDFYFNIDIKANETKDFYLKVSSLSCAVYFELYLMTKDELYYQDINHQLILTLFFGVILALILYNFFIFLFTRDIVYIYYILYLFFTIWNHGSYTTMSMYITKYFPPDFIKIDAYLAIFYMCFISIFTILFTRKFLNIKRYKKIDILLKIMIAFNIILLIVTSPEFYPIEIATVILFASISSMVPISYYLLYKKEPNAKFFVVGWTIAISGWIMLATQQYGYFSIINEYKYFYEFTIFIEAILFSIALSSKLNKTKELEISVKRNEVLTKELHHRVKNNMQFIISLYRLKLNDEITQKVDDKLKDVENSIKAMSNIHEILYDRDDIEKIDTKEYFKTLVTEIQNTYKEKEINISLNCDTTLDVNKAIYCGIILNELVTNSFKYAFNDKNGEINISIILKNKKIILTIEDNGIGYDTRKPSKGFGLELVKSLVENELKGKMKTISQNGIKYEIVS